MSISMTTIKTILYPRPAYTRVIIQWADGEWDQMVSANRDTTLFALKGTVDRLVLPPAVTRMRQEILSPGSGGPEGELAGQAPRKELLDILLGNLRYHGYIHRDGSGWVMNPLTPRQLHLIKLLAQGHTLKSAASYLGIKHSSTRRICQGAMETTGLRTSTGMTAQAYYRGWIPCRNESENLARRLGRNLGPGYITR